ncbi:MAG: hypothetical protein NVS3B5_19860 [Sphingomicrobium sp.]
MNEQGNFLQDLADVEEKLLEELRSVRRNARLLLSAPEPEDPAVATLSRGQRIADAVARTMGSWRFIIVQSTLLGVWVTLNVTAWRAHWDPYPFILLNLALSFQAAYAAPFIMMSQNRQQEIDRTSAENDHQVNLKAELEIELVHKKLNALRETEVMYLTKAVNDLTQLLKNRSNFGTSEDVSKPPEAV